MKTWTKETPVAEGWFWIRYRGDGRNVECPCKVTHLGDGTTIVHTARGDDFIEGPSHGGPGLKCGATPMPSIRFGPAIPPPGGNPP